MMTESLQRPGIAFDQLATDYDASFTATTLGKWLRSVVWERLDARFAGHGRILEIGCGTGEDAVHLACLGHEVLATDVSRPMLAIAQEKAKRAGCAQRIEFRCISMDRLGVELDRESFDGAFSNFGAVNCAARLEQLVTDIAALMKPNAPLVWVVMGRHVPWEWAWFLARLDWRRAFRRLRKGGATWRGMRIQYPTPRELAQSLSPEFVPACRRVLGLVLPPSYASHWLEHRPRTFAALARIERAAQKWQPLAALADHYIIEAHRAPANADA